MHFWLKCKMVQLLWKTVWQSLKNFKIELLCDPAIPLMSVCPEELKGETQRDACMFIHNIIIHNC